MLAECFSTVCYCSSYHGFFVIVFLDHTCTYLGCTNVLVIDGNCKNRRDICAATEAGFIENGSLPGMIMTECQHTPMQNSPFCCQHAPRVSVTLPVADTDDAEITLMTEKAQQKAAEKYYQRKKHVVKHTIRYNYNL